MKLGEALGAVAALQQERAALRDIRQQAAQAARLASKDQGWVATQFGLDGVQRRLVRIDRLLQGGQAAPAIDRPFDRHYPRLC